MSNNHPAPRQKPANISDPPKFSGKLEDLEAFKNMVNIKLTGNAEQFPSDQYRLAYVYGRLEGNCHNPRRPNPCPTILVILTPVTLRIS